MSTETNAPWKVTKESKVTVPLALLAAFVIAVATGYAALTTTREQVNRNTADISVLNQKVATDHDLLIEIRGDVKRLLKEDKHP